MFLFNERKGFIPVSRNFGAVKVCMFIKDGEFLYDTYSVEKFLSKRLGFKIDLSKYVAESCEEYRVFTDNDFVRDLTNCPKIPRIASFEVDSNYFVSRAYPVVDENCLFRIFVSLLFDIIPELEPEEAERIEVAVEIARKDITRMEEDLSFLIAKIEMMDKKKALLESTQPQEEVACTVVEEEEKPKKESKTNKDSKSKTNKPKTRKTNTKKKDTVKKTTRTKTEDKTETKPLYEVITDKDKLSAKSITGDLFKVENKKPKTNKGSKAQNKNKDILSNDNIVYLPPTVINCDKVDRQEPEIVDVDEIINENESVHKTKDDSFNYDNFGRPLMYGMENPSFFVPRHHKIK